MKATATKTAVGKAAVSVTIRIIARIIAIGIVPVVWIGIVKERVPKITKEEESIVEAAIVEPTATKATIMKAAATKATVKAAGTKAASAEAAAVTATTTAMRRHVRARKSTNCKSNCHCNKFFVIHIHLSIC
jgi:hypothetical protein